MNARMVRGSLVVLVVSCIWPGFATTVAAKRAPRGAAVIRITAQRIEHVRVDVGRRGPSSGDIETSRSLLYNKSIRGRPIGHSEIVCVATSSASSSCTGVFFFLPRGKLFVLGPIQPGDDYRVPVVGGTGLYANIHGTLTASSLDRRPLRELLVFTVYGLKSG
jgi:hypothetical protein